MANSTLKTDSIPRLIDLTKSEMDVFLGLCKEAKYNSITMDDKTYEKLEELTKLKKKSIQNTLTELVKKEIVVKAGTLTSYVIDPTIITTGNYDKCVKYYDAANKSEQEFKSLKKQASKNARPDFEKNMLDGYIKSKQREVDLDNN